ncbi:pyridoxal-phosphate dependent enzyme [Streptomyces sp. NPDC050617]|uniref:pyridoxal-phosphate dependent enzyme n=1 Tax=Streptomyces sp. NPDC050617 TaxID=3154628 RepID=UPI00343C7954
MPKIAAASARTPARTPAGGPAARTPARTPVRTPSWYARPAARAWTCEPAPADVRAFHASLPGYRPTPLTELPEIAAELGVGRFFVKDESSRLGLPAFKALGASWAVHRVLSSRGAGDGAPLRLVTATDGNHGRAVARTARLLGHRAHVFVAAGVHPGAVAAIAGEGARVTEVPGVYDDAVRAAEAAAAAPDSVLVQDTAWPGYEEIPGWIAEGYSTLFAEVDDQLTAAGAGAPSLVAVPVGVGSLAQAAVTHYRGRRSAGGAALLSVEPENAAGVLHSLLAGRPLTVATGATTMAGLNCGTPSSLAWPYLRDGLDAAVTVTDAAGAVAARALAAHGVSSGPCGAASLAGLRAALTGEGAADRRTELGLGSGAAADAAADSDTATDVGTDVATDAVVVALSTEGAAANPHGG